jgi:hypothetical protein
MRKIFLIIEGAFKPDENFEREQAVNSLMNLIFKEKKTADSIKIFEDFKKKFDQEIAKRGIDGLIEHTICEEYFDRTQKNASNNLKKSI